MHRTHSRLLLGGENKRGREHMNSIGKSKKRRAIQRKQIRSGKKKGDTWCQRGQEETMNKDLFKVELV